MLEPRLSFYYLTSLQYGSILSHLCYMDVLVKCWDNSVPIWDIRFDLGLHIWIVEEQYNISTQLMLGSLYSPWGGYP